MDMFSGDNSNYNKFSISASPYATKDFLESNSLVAQVAFLLLTFFVFIILLRLGISLLSWMLGPNNSPHFIDGMQEGKQLKVFSQNPAIKGSQTIGRSQNEQDGIEFTWSTWIYIDDLTYNSGIYKHIFHKGDDPSRIAQNGKVFPNNAPGLYIAPNTNALAIVMNTFNDMNQEVTIPDIPLNKWVNVVIRCQNTTMDVYINGVITQSVVLAGVPKQNYGDVWLCANGGFSGYVSNLWYYNYALNASQILALFNKGPNRTILDSSASDLEMKKPDYLSLRWYFFGNQDMFNP
jgi:hypothetical protein